MIRVVFSWIICLTVFVVTIMVCERVDLIKKYLDDPF